MPRRATTEEFIAAAEAIHGDRYDYSLVDYKGRHVHVTIKCPEHGPFIQKPVYHTLRQSGCPECAKWVCPKDTFDVFVAKANNTHNGAYEYDKSTYNNATTKVSIICKHHGPFMQLPFAHVYGQGCPTCAQRPFSRPCISWLEQISVREQIHIQHAQNGGEFWIPGTNFKVDGFCSDTNTVYEFHGDFWHGNPAKFDAEQLHPVCNKTMGELYQRTKQREEIITALGYNLVTLWESEWNIMKRKQC